MSKVNSTTHTSEREETSHEITAIIKVFRNEFSVFGKSENPEGKARTTNS